MLNYVRIWSLFITGSRLLLGLIFLSSGIAKLIPGTVGLIGPVWLIARLAEYGLGLYAEFIAASQVLVGGLLLTRRLATLGAVMALPLLLNILMVTISLGWQGTPYIVGFLTVLNLALLAADYHKLKFLVAVSPAPLREVPAPMSFTRLDWLALTLVLGLIGLGLLVHHLQPAGLLGWRRVGATLRWALLLVLALQAWQARKPQAARQSHR